MESLAFEWAGWVRRCIVTNVSWHLLMYWKSRRKKKAKEAHTLHLMGHQPQGFLGFQAPRLTPAPFPHLFLSHILGPRLNYTSFPGYLAYRQKIKGLFVPTLGWTIPLKTAPYTFLSILLVRISWRTLTNPLPYCMLPYDCPTLCPVGIHHP